MPVYNPGGSSSSSSNDIQPSDVGMLTWAFDPAAISGGFTPTAGTLYIVRQPVRKVIAPTQAVVAVQTAGTGVQPLVSTFAGLYDKNGVLRSASVDESTTFSTAGIRSVNLVVQGGQTNTISDTDGYCWFGFLVGTQATTPLALRAAAGIAGVTNMGLNQSSTPPARSLSLAAVGSSLPATITVSSFSTNNTLHSVQFA